MGESNLLQRNTSEAVQSSLRSFNYTNGRPHAQENQEIELRADEVLYSLLLTLVSDGGGQVADNAPLAIFSTRQRQKIGKVCKRIEIMYRCSKEKAGRSFQRVGLDFLDVFSVVLSDELHKHCTLGFYQNRFVPSDSNGQTLTDWHHSSSQNGRQVPIDSTIISVTRIISSFARVPSAATAMAKHGRLIELLECIIDCSNETISFESQHNSLWVLANVACDKENGILLLSNNSRLLHTLIRVASDPGSVLRRNSNSVLTHSYQALLLQRTALRSILNLSFVEGAADLIMSRSDVVLTSICQMVIIPTEQFRINQRIYEAIFQIKRYSVQILYSISNSSVTTKRLLCRFQSGVVLQSLGGAANNDGDAVVQRLATLTLANLVIVHRA